MVNVQGPPLDFVGHLCLRESVWEFTNNHQIVGAEQEQVRQRIERERACVVIGSVRKIRGDMLNCRQGNFCYET